MRWIAFGLLLVAASVGLSEYARRHPSSPGGADAGVAEPEAPPKPSISMDDLTRPAAATVKPPADLAALGDLFTPADGGVDFAAKVSARGAVSGQTRAAFVVERSRTYGVATVAVDRAPTVSLLTARTEPISSVALDGERLVWAEGGQVLEWKDGAAVGLVAFPKAQVAGLAVKGGQVLVALVPQGADPFSTEPNGAVVRVDAPGQAQRLVGELVRPHDLLVEGGDVFFVAGYPSGLYRAALDGAFSARTVERADGPLAFDGSGIVHRFPESQAPEVRRVPRAGGNVTTLARVDADFLAGRAGLAAYTTTGLGARVFTVVGTDAPKELLPFTGAAKGLAFAGEHVVLLSVDELGQIHLRAR